MSVSARFEVKHAFVLRPPQVRSLWATLERYIGPVKAEASCADGLSRTFTAQDDLLSYENSRARALSTISFSARSSDHESRATVTFGERYSATIEASASGDEERIIGWRQSLEEVVDGCRPWYSAIARVDFSDVVLAIFIFSSFVLMLMADGSKKAQPMTLNQALTSAFVVVGAIGVVIFATIGLNRLRRRFFPTATFAIGQGESRFTFDENIRWVVIVGFLVSLFSSLVFAFLWG